MSKRALFLDRDGVINVDFGYVYKQEDVKFIDGIFELVAIAKTLDYFVLVVTNQAGIGRGYYKEEDFHILMNWMKSKFVEHNGQIDAVYFCPYHPEHGIGMYRRKSSFRKPAPGMLIQAQHDFDLDMRDSIFVGDKISDMEAGRAAGVGTLLQLSCNKTSSDFLSIQRLVDVLPFLLPLLPKR